MGSGKLRALYPGQNIGLSLDTINQAIYIDCSLPTSPQGFTGPTGPTGNAGSQGISGAIGPTGSPGTGFVLAATRGSSTTRAAASPAAW